MCRNIECEGVNMTINFATMAKIAKKNPKTYSIADIYNNKGWKNVIRNVQETNGRFTSRIQTFDEHGKLYGTSKRIDEHYTIYSEPNENRLCLQYFVPTKEPKAPYLDCFDAEFVNTTAKNLADVRAFYKLHADKMK